MAGRAGAAASEYDASCMAAAGDITATTSTESSRDMHMHTESSQLKRINTIVSMNNNDAVSCESIASDSSSARNCNSNNNTEQCTLMLDKSTCKPRDSVTAGTTASAQSETAQLLATLAAANEPQRCCADISDSSTACVRNGDSDCESDYV
jgi:hypothetical protein